MSTKRFFSVVVLISVGFFVSMLFSPMMNAEHGQSHGCLVATLGGIDCALGDLAGSLSRALHHANGFQLLFQNTPFFSSLLLIAGISALAASMYAALLRKFSLPSAIAAISLQAPRRVPLSLSASNRHFARWIAMHNKTDVADVR